jgi:hypothetical protein
MIVNLTPDQKAFVRDAIASGRLHGEEDAIARSAYSVGATRACPRAEILASVDVAEAALACGEGRVITQESMRDLAAEVKRRGRARVAAARDIEPLL